MGDRRKLRGGTPGLAFAAGRAEGALGRQEAAPRGATGLAFAGGRDGAALRRLGAAPGGAPGGGAAAGRAEAASRFNRDSAGKTYNA